MGVGLPLKFFFSGTNTTLAAGWYEALGILAHLLRMGMACWGSDCTPQSSSDFRWARNPGAVPIFQGSTRFILVKKMEPNFKLQSWDEFGGSMNWHPRKWTKHPLKNAATGRRCSFHLSFLKWYLFQVTCVHFLGWSSTNLLHFMWKTLPSDDFMSPSHRIPKGP